VRTSSSGAAAGLPPPPLLERGQNLSQGHATAGCPRPRRVGDSRARRGTSSIDPRTEGLIQDALPRVANKNQKQKKGEQHGPTSIVIAHRLQTIQADSVLVLQHGEVGRIGTHDERLARAGVYRTVVRAAVMSGWSGMIDSKRSCADVLPFSIGHHRHVVLFVGKTSIQQLRSCANYNVPDRDTEGCCSRLALASCIRLRYKSISN